MPRGGARPGAGRPKGVKNGQGKNSRVDDVSQAARVHTREALNTLLTVMRSKTSPPTAKAKAATAILAYGWGSPPSMDRQDLFLAAKETPK